VFPAVAPVGAAALGEYLRRAEVLLDQTRVEVLEALAPLGADYVEHFRRLLDPATGCMDIAAERRSCHP
jgi:hypothetical protein